MSKPSAAGLCAQVELMSVLTNAGVAGQRCRVCSPRSCCCADAVGLVAPVDWLCCQLWPGESWALQRAM